MTDKQALIYGIISRAAEATTRFDSSVAVDPDAVSFLANQTRADELALDDADKLKIFAAAVSVFSTVATTPSDPSVETVDASAYLVRTVDVEAMMRFVLPWPWNTSSKASSDVSKQPATTAGDDRRRLRLGPDGRPARNQDGARAERERWLIRRPMHHRRPWEASANF